MSKFGSSNPSHIRLPYRKVLASKVHFYAAEPTERSADSDPRHFLELLDVVANHALKSEGSERLDDYVQSRLVEQIHPSYPFDSPGHQFHFLHQALKGIDCAICASERKICDDADEFLDSENVTKAGLCIQPLLKLFRVSEGVAKHYYERYAPGSVRPIRFSTANSMSLELNDVLPEYFVGGKTELERLSSTVILTLNSERMDRDTYYAILYILFHECICHAFQQSVQKETGLRSGCGNDDPFGEGWMDFTAWQVLEEFLGGIPEELAPLLEEVPQAAELLKVCRRFHEDRHRPDAKHPCKMVYVHHKGWLAAHYVQRRLARLDVTDPEVTFYNLTFGFNAGRTTKEARAAFVEKLALGLEPYERQKGRLAGSSPYDKALLGYAEDGDTSAFVRAVLPSDFGNDYSFDK